MANVKLIVLIIIFLLIIAGIFIIYKYKGESSIKYIDNLNCSISFLFKDSVQIETGYLILYNNTIYKSGKSTKNDYLMENVIFNQSIFIYNTNLNDQNYYITNTSVICNENKRLNINLERIGSVEMSNNKIDDLNISLVINSIGIVKDSILCLRWSDNIIRVNALNRSIVEVPVNYYNKYDKCYEIGTLKNNGTIVHLQVEPFGILLDDYINVVLIDKDYILDESNNFIVTNWYNNSDIFMEDFIYKLK